MLWNPSLRKTLSHPAAVHRQLKVTKNHTVASTSRNASESSSSGRGAGESTHNSTSGSMEDPAEQQPRSASQPSSSSSSSTAGPGAGCVTAERSIKTSAFSLLTSSKSFRYSKSSSSKKKSLLSSTVAGDLNVGQRGNAFSRPLESIFGSLTASSKRFATSGTQLVTYQQSHGASFDHSITGTAASATVSSTDTMGTTSSPLDHAAMFDASAAIATSNSVSGGSSNSRGVGAFFDHLIKRKDSSARHKVTATHHDSSPDVNRSTSPAFAPKHSPFHGPNSHSSESATIGTGTANLLPTSLSLDRSSGSTATIKHPHQSHSQTSQHPKIDLPQHSEQQPRRWSECGGSNQDGDCSHLSARLANAKLLQNSSDSDHSRSPTPVSANSPSGSVANSTNATM